MRVAGSNKADTWSRLKAAGIDLLFKHGYEAMNTRQLAEAAGLKPGSIYYYFKSKEEFLHRLLIDLLQEVVADLEGGLEDVGDVEQRLETYVRILVRWHVDRREETFIASIEIRSLSGQRHERYMLLRRRFDALLAEILQQGIDEERFAVPNEPVLRNAILSMITGICGWYDPAGPLGLSSISDEFVRLTRNMVGLPSR
ncbi:transcriptional regulator, TetR family [Frankia torreyi]|uniref:Transcriptional regulator, TetR family n=2 Tax=Frankia TaxID=1854 RepID=A0A0D8BCE3_9ACTN|nr:MULTISPECIES: TetR/AcrR family transcriptional regulator [Frankia]KJE21725.1 transcriptional regulator, TetR family [Frankia torreyi]